MEKINFKSISKELSREEMKNIMAGTQGDCPVSISCPDGQEVECDGGEFGWCYSEGEGTCGGFVNCNGGQEINGCWEVSPSCPS